MTSTENIKKSTSYKTLLQISMRLHNPQVSQAYKESLDSEPEPLRVILLKNLTIFTSDSIFELILKILIFYLIESRIFVSVITPQWWNLKRERFVPQLCIKFRPVGTRHKFGFRDYARNPELHIPHYNGSSDPKIPTYTIGQQSAKYILKDGSYILVNAESVSEAIEVVAKLANYTKDDKRPDGGIEENITTTKRKRKLKESGIKIAPFQAVHTTVDSEGIKEKTKIQL